MTMFHRSVKAELRQQGSRREPNDLQPPVPPREDVLEMPQAVPGRLLTSYIVMIPFLPDDSGGCHPVGLRSASRPLFESRVRLPAPLDAPSVGRRRGREGEEDRLAGRRSGFDGDGVDAVAGDAFPR